MGRAVPYVLKDRTVQRNRSYPGRLDSSDWLKFFENETLSGYFAWSEAG